MAGEREPCYLNPVRRLLDILTAICVFAAPCGGLAERPTDPAGIAGAHAAEPAFAGAPPFRPAPPAHGVRSLPPFVLTASAPLPEPRERAWTEPRAAEAASPLARRASVSSRGPPRV